MNQESSLKRPALYNPALWSRDEVRRYYVARPKILARLLDDLRREQPGTRPQHRLILGQRGMGKSTLLRRLAIGVEDDSELAAQWLPLNFPEEQYNVATLADFWLNCLDALGDWLEGRGQLAEMQALDAEIERLDRKDGEGALLTLLRLAAKLQRRLLLLVDNIDLILERLKNKDWALREALQEHPELLLVGASSRALEATYDYGAAFYDFFQIDELRGLSQEEMHDTIANLARLRGADDLMQHLDHDPGRLRVLHTLTGGNPRTAVLLYGVLLKGIDGDVRSDLEALLDEVTPLYKARFDELPAQAQQLLDKLALHWDPMSARQAADALGWPVNQASAQLDRLAQAGIVEKLKVGGSKRMAFQVAERFFNIWYLMRASRRVRRKLMWLVEFLRVFFSSEELQRLAKNGLQGRGDDTRNAEYHLALCRALGPQPLARALETRALGSLLSGRGAALEELLDLRGEDRDLADRAQQISDRKALDKALDLLAAKEGMAEVAEQLRSWPVSSKKIFKVIDDFQEALPEKRPDLLKAVVGEINWLKELYGSLGYSQLSEAVLLGYQSDPLDIEGGEAAAVGLNYPLLSLIPHLHILEGAAERYETLSRRAIELDSSGALYWLALADALLRRLDYVGASEAAQRVLQLVSEDRATHSRVAGLLALCPDAGNLAEEIFRQILDQDREYFPALVGIVPLLLLDEAKFGEALVLAREACVLNPEDAQAWVCLALALGTSAANAAERLSALERANALPVDSGLVLYMLLKHHLIYGSELEIKLAAANYFEYLGGGESVGMLMVGSDAELLSGILAVAVKRDVAPLLLAEFDKTEAAQRFRVVREALHAAVEENVEVLDWLAPELRQPALEVLAVIAPQVLPAARAASPL